MASKGRFAVLALAIFVSLIFAAACSQSDPRWDKFRNLTYVPGSSNKNQRLDLYLPKVPEGAQSKPLPLIIWVHGGSWRGGDKNSPPWLDRFIKNGYAVASLSYRLVTNDANNPGKFPAQINDVKAAVRFLRSQSNRYHLDPGHFGAFGSSAGGHLVALLGASNGVAELEGSLGNANQSSEVQAVCDACGPANFFSLNQPFYDLSKGVLLHPGPAAYPQASSSQMLGDIPSNRPDIARLASPVTMISAKTPPFLILHGTKDNVVPLAQSRELDIVLKDKHIDSTLLIVEGADHNVLSADKIVWPAVIQFFDKHLKGTP